LEPVCNTGFSQLVGIAVINTCAVMLLFVYFGKMIKLLPRYSISNNEQGNQNVVYQGQQQYPYDQSYGNYNNPKLYYIYNGSTYETYH
jgi:hypothetical protein